MCDTLLNLFEDLFSPRQAEVVVNGVSSVIHVLSEQVYQGTVFGPPRWNVFFKDVSLPVVQRGAVDPTFADDLTASKVFPASTGNNTVLEQLGHCQEFVHHWGRENRVQFDPAKEKLDVLHRTSPYGHTGRILGALVDPKLLMDEEVERILRKVRPKIKSMLRATPLCSCRDMLQQFNTHI
jgi:hypothetical protein